MDKQHTTQKRSLEVNLKHVFLLRHTPIYNYYLPFFYEAVSEDQLRSIPNARVNSIVWCLWHVARAEDIGVNQLAMDQSQVVDEGPWLKRMNVPFRHFGIGMAGAEVAHFSEAVNIVVLKEYHQMVGSRTCEVLNDLSATDFNQVLQDAHLRGVLEEEGAVRITERQQVYESYQGMTRGWVLMHLGLTHTFQHIGEAMTIASLLRIQR